MGTFSAPERTPPAPIERVVDDGVLISMWSVRMAIKNRLIVGALRDDLPFDEAALRAAAREEILAVAAENDDTADRLEGHREAADALEGGMDFDFSGYGFGSSAARPAPAVDEEHRRRPRVHRLLAKALRAKAEDEDALAELVSAAQTDAVDDVGREILARAFRVAEPAGFVPGSDDDYEAERSIRLRMFLDFDLAALEEDRDGRRDRADQPAEDRDERS